MPTEEEIKRIVELYDNGNGLSHGQIARELNYNQSTITRTINKFFGKNQDAPNDAHESMHQCKTKSAVEAKATYDLIRRRALNDKLFAKLEEAIERDMSSSDLKNYCISFGILEDKRQIIEPVQGTNGTAAIDIYIEELKREASADEPKAEGQRPSE